VNDNQSNPPVDWTVFKDGDRVRVTFEGTLDRGRDGLDDERWLNVGRCRSFRLGPLGGVSTALTEATSAELIERPFDPPAAGKLFAYQGDLFISDGDSGYYRIRRHDGSVDIDRTACHWGYASDAFRHGIVVELDI
jgi:hypothetical protein